MTFSDNMWHRLIATEESLLLRWKLERLSVAEKLRQLYAFEAQAQALELQGFEAAPEVVARAAPRRIPVEVAWRGYMGAYSCHHVGDLAILGVTIHISCKQSKRIQMKGCGPGLAGILV